MHRTDNTVTRRGALGSLAAALAGCGPRSVRRPNILFVMTDDHASGELSCYGNRVLHTPNMDRIATSGTRFSNAFVTNSLCAPSRATGLTGCYSHVNGIRGNSESKDANERLSPGIATWPRLLQQAGYRTGIAGKWHLNDAPAGFDYSSVLPGQGLYFDPDFIENGKRRKVPGYATDITTDLALRFLDETAGKPFALVYQHKAPHRPFTPAPRHAAMFSADLPYPATFDDDYATRRLAREAADMKFDISLAGDYKDLPAKLPPAERKRWIYQRFVKDHYRAVFGVDENLGRVLDYLDRKNLAENTLILYTSDNGFFLGEHGWYDKRWMYEPALRVPLLARYPAGAAPAGRTEDRMALNIDFAPTILDYAGVAAPASMQGRSLRPLIEGKPAQNWRQSMLYTYYENSWALAGKGKEAMSDPSFQYFTAHRVSPHRGVRTARYKLIEYYSEDGYWELFDLQADPHEVRNVYGDPAYQSVVAQLKPELVRLRDQFRETQS